MSSATAAEMPQSALLAPLIVGILGFVASLRMVRLPDIEPSVAAEEFAFG